MTSLGGEKILVPDARETGSVTVLHPGRRRGLPEPSSVKKNVREIVLLS